MRQVGGDGEEPPEQGKVGDRHDEYKAVLDPLGGAATDQAKEAAHPRCDGIDIAIRQGKVGGKEKPSARQAQGGVVGEVEGVLQVKPDKVKDGPAVEKEGHAAARNLGRAKSTKQTHSQGAQHSIRADKHVDQGIDKGTKTGLDDVGLGDWCTQK